MYEYLNLIVEISSCEITKEGYAQYQRDLAQGVVKQSESVEAYQFWSFDIKGLDSFPTEEDTSPWRWLENQNLMLRGINLAYDYLGQQKWSMISQIKISESPRQSKERFLFYAEPAKGREDVYYPCTHWNIQTLVAFQRNAHIY